VDYSLGRGVVVRCVKRGGGVARRGKRGEDRGEVHFFRGKSWFVRVDLCVYVCACIGVCVCHLHARPNSGCESDRVCCTYLHIHIYTYTHACIRAYIHACIGIDLQIYIHTYT